MGKYDRLYGFIPYLEAATKDKVVKWGGGTKIADDIMTMPYPIYSDQLKEFINVIYELDILDENYLNTIQSYNLQTSEEFESALIHADYKLTVALLTYYVRQERFHDGFWAEAVENKIFLKLIKRLFELETYGYR